MALAAQGFDRPRPRKVSARDLGRVIRQLGLVQIDTINVLARAHYQVPFSRLGPYKKSVFDDVVYRSREFTEQWAHEASIVPVASWPLLRHRIATLGLEDRVHIVPPVPMTALVREAAAFDVGFFALPGHSHHNQFALPNKFFEYTMAGLALCMTDLPEMARLMQEYDLGVTFPKVEPGLIAQAVNALTPERIDHCKRNALAAARELCWDREAERLVSAYTAAVSRVAIGA